MIAERPDFPSMAGHPHWPGAWKWGVDFSGGSVRVIAVATQGPDSKYGTVWLGPIAITPETAARLEAWAQDHLDGYGGYVHLFPANGDALAELREWCDDRDDDDEEDA